MKDDNVIKELKELNICMAKIYTSALKHLNANGAGEGKLVIARTPHSALRIAIAVYIKLSSYIEKSILKLKIGADDFFRGASPPVFLIVRSAFLFLVATGTLLCAYY